MLREIWFGKVWTARPVTVIQDTEDLLALWIAPGTIWLKPALGLRMPDPISRQWPLEEATWLAGGAVRTTKPGASRSVLAFYSDTGEFSSWYVNIETPLRRTLIGFDFTDLLLDVLVTPEMEWTLKDEDELKEAVSTGLLSGEEKRAIEREAELLINAIATSAEEFDERWKRWRPDPSWPIPELPENWNSTV